MRENLTSFIDEIDVNKFEAALTNYQNIVTYLENASIELSKIEN